MRSAAHCSSRRCPALFPFLPPFRLPVQGLLLLLASILVTRVPAAGPPVSPTPSPSRELLVICEDGTEEILPTWLIGSRRVFALGDLLRLDRSLVSRGSGYCELAGHGSRLRVLAGGRFALLDGRVIVLGGPVTVREGQLLVDLDLLDLLLDEGLVRGSLDDDRQRLRIERPACGLIHERLEGGEVFRLRLARIPVYESRVDGARLELGLPPGSGLETLDLAGGMPDWMESNLARSLETDVSREEQLLSMRLWKGAELLEIVELESLGEIQVVLRQRGRVIAGGDWSEAPAPVLTRPLKPIELDLVVIDPGHGGRDPGAVSPRGKYEKRAVLEISRELARLLKEELPGVRVVMTREDDRFLSLGERTAAANRAGAKLFISIHANSAKDRRARGWEVYFLRPGKNRHAREVALRENSVISFEEESGAGGPENWILASMAQSAYAAESQNLATLIAGKMKGIGHTRRRTVLQAGFQVLVGASMPAVLVECGFISNRKDEQLLFSREGQRRVARALVESIREFRELYR